jgi:hypothetical protein
MCRERSGSTFRHRDWIRRPAEQPRSRYRICRDAGGPSAVVGVWAAGGTIHCGVGPATIDVADRPGDAGPRPRGAAPSTPRPSPTRHATPAASSQTPERQSNTAAEQPCRRSCPPTTNRQLTPRANSSGSTGKAVGVGHPSRQRPLLAAYPQAGVLSKKPFVSVGVHVKAASSASTADLTRSAERRHRLPGSGSGAGDRKP